MVAVPEAREFALDVVRYFVELRGWQLLHRMYYVGNMTLHFKNILKLNIMTELK